MFSRVLLHGSRVIVGSPEYQARHPALRQTDRSEIAGRTSIRGGMPRLFLVKQHLISKKRVVPSLCRCYVHPVVGSAAPLRHAWEEVLTRGGNIHATRKGENIHAKPIASEIHSV